MTYLQVVLNNGQAMKPVWETDSILIALPSGMLIRMQAKDVKPGMHTFVNNYFEDRNHGVVTAVEKVDE